MIEARPTPPPRGVWALDILERPFLALERLGRRLLPFELDPIANMGALANLTFIIAAITGTLLLFWYVPSVRQAYHSLKALEESALVGQLVRSLHRYSSDACMFFVLLHALRYFFGRRFAGPRWLAWLTGVASLGLIWFVGWTGYWLVWDERARQVALGTAKMMDVVPIFNESLSRSFLVDGDVNTFLFFVVFFGHMLIPLLVGIGLWLHITRLSRPRFLPSRALGLWTLASLALMGLLWPATSVEPAHMGVNPEGFTMDWWYLLPLTLTDRLSAGALWLSFFASGTIVLFLPWIARRGHPVPAEVQPSKCNDCRKCAADCPYGAIEMRPREDTSRYERVATIDPSKCVGCGICAGSCDSAGIGVPWMAAPSARTRLDGWIEAAKAAGERPRVAFVCACSAGAALSIDPETGHSPGLPGYLVWAVPCAGWVHPLTVERAIRHGAEGVLIVSSAPGGCSFREGGVWTDLRMRGERLPELRADQVDPARVRILHLDRAQGKALRAQASAFTASDPPPGAPQPDGSTKPNRLRLALAGAALTLALGVATVLGSDAPYRTPLSAEPELVVSFKLAGASGENCRTLSEEEKAAMPPHMRRDEICERSRAAVRLRIRVDGEEAYAGAYEPAGLFGDGSSLAMVTIPLSEGTHRVQVALGETSDPEEWTHLEEAEVESRVRERRVIVFDRAMGFRWY